MHRVTLIPGDGIGPEVAAAARHVVDAVGAGIEWDVQEAGVPAIETHGAPMPPHVLDSIKANRVALKGPVTTQVGTGFRSVNVALRQELDLYASVRPCRLYPGVPSRYEDVDLVVVRENTEDVYTGIEFEVGTVQVKELIRFLEDSGISVKSISGGGSERIVRFAFEQARRGRRTKVTAGHKANIMKFSD